MSFSKQLKQLLHPYVFVLKEGKGFSRDCMSYDLMMLHINNEIIKSPKNDLLKEEENSLQAELEMLKAAVPKALARICGADA
jgi:hypothetical protein